MEQLFEPLLTHSKFPHVMTSRTGDQLDLIIKKIAGPRCGPRTIAGKPLAVCTLPRERVTQQATVPGVIAGRFAPLDQSTFRPRHEKMPSRRRASNRVKLALRIESGSGRISSPSSANMSRA
jgi:hypothetical protein